MATFARETSSKNASSLQVLKNNLKEWKPKLSM